MPPNLLQQPVKSPGAMSFYRAPRTLDDGLTWLINLRWLAVTGQLAAIYFAADILTVPTTLTALLCTVALIALSNILLLWSRIVSSPRNIGSVILFDVASLTALLYFSGGASNPFGFFYVIHVALAAILLGEAWTWTLAAISSLCYGLLFFYAVDLPALSGHHHGAASGFSLHLQGMWVAFTLTAVSLAFFFTRIVAALRGQQIELAAVREKALRNERLAAVTSLAAMAAHELNTPLATIHLVAEEMSSERREHTADSRDAALILAEVNRCRAILERLRLSSGSQEGAKAEEISIEEAFEEINARVPAAPTHEISITNSARELTILAPRRPLIEAVLALVKNACEAGRSHPNVPVRIQIDATRDKDRQRLTISDDGAGMPPELLKHVGEPFFSTKPSGAGMGLGVFLARSFVEALGGTLNIHSQPGLGTEVTLEFPA